MPVKTTIGYKYLGFVPYSESLEIQRELHHSVLTGELGMEGCILFLYHEPVITFGKYCSDKNLLVDKNRLSDLGINVYRSERGGDITCHEPGQLVIYPIMNLKKLNLGVKNYVGNLENTVIQFLTDYDINGEIVAGRPGVWVGSNKIASIGINISKFVTTHGVAINVSNSLTSFNYVNPCGYPDIGMTSIKRLTGESHDLEMSGLGFLKYFENIFDVSVVENESDYLKTGLKNYISSSA